MKTIQRWRTLGAALLLLGLFCPLMAQGLQDEKASFEFAQRLFDGESYANAAQEFRLFMMNFPTSDRLPEALLRMGDALFLSAQYQDAVDACQNFIDKHPDHFEAPTAMRRKAKALERLEEYTKAGAAFQEVHEAFPGGEYAPQDLLSAGRNFHRGGDLEAAESAFRALITRYPRSPLVHEAVYNIGLVLLDADRVEDALAQFHTLAEYKGATERKPDALLEMGKIALAREDLEGAEALLATLRRSFPQSVSAETSYLVMAAWFAHRGDWQRAVDTYIVARKVLPRSERRQQAILVLSEAYRELGQSDRALSLYEEFLRSYASSPFLARARLGLGQAYADLGNYRNALAAFSRLQEEFPNVDVSVQAYIDVGDIRRKLGTPRQALNAYNAYVEWIEPPGAKAPVLLRIARLYEEDLNWHDRAREGYRALIDSASAPYAAEAQFGLARSLEKTAHDNLALREYRVYLEKFPGGARAQDAETRIRLLREFAPTENRNQTGDLLTLIAGLPTLASDPNAQFRLGFYLYQNRHYHTAAERFQAAIGDSSSFDHAPWAAYLLGDSYLKLALKARLEGHSQEAQAYQDSGLAAHRNVISRYPDSEWTDDADLALIGEAMQDVAPDTTRAQRMLEAYGAFRDAYPNSDRLDVAHLRTADAYVLLGNADPAQIGNALKTYRSLQRRFPNSPLAEQAAYGIGICQAQQQDYVQAEETLRTFLFDFPQSDLADHARLQLGRIFLARGFYRSAAEELSGLLNAPSSVDLEHHSRELLAESYFRMGDYRRAVEIDEGLLERGTTPSVLRRLARSYRESGQHENAARVYAIFLRAFFNAADADSIAFSRAELLAQLGRTSEAISAFRDFGRKYPASPIRSDAGRGLGDLLYQTGAYAKAIKAYRDIPPADRNESVAGKEILSLFKLKRIKEAQKDAKQFKKTYKTARNWLALFDVERGVYYLNAGNHKRARKIFEDVIKNYAGADAVADARYHLIRALEKEGGQNETYQEALEAFVNNHTDSPYWPRATVELAEFFYKNDDYVPASRAYGKALASDLAPEEEREILWKLVEVHSSLKLRDNAIGYARQLVRKFPRDARATDARIRIGTLLRDKGDYQQGIQELVPLLKVTAKDDWSLVQYTIAECYQKMDDPERAKREYLKLLYNNQGSTMWLASAHYGLADCAVAQGDYRQAIQELQTIRKKFGSASDFGLQAADRIRNIQHLLNTAAPPLSGQK